MNSKTVFAETSYDEAIAGIREVPLNKTLYIDQFTDLAPVKPGDVKQFEKMEDVFDYYKPEKKGVQMYDQEGRSIKENFRFNAIKDFDDNQLISQSSYLSQQKSEMESYKNIEMQLIKNKLLRRIFQDEDGRKNLVSVLKALVAELEK